MDFMHSRVLGKVNLPPPLARRSFLIRSPTATQIPTMAKIASASVLIHGLPFVSLRVG
jgi:hypothetical protein